MHIPFFILLLFVLFVALRKVQQQTYKAVACLHDLNTQFWRWFYSLTLQVERGAKLAFDNRLSGAGEELVNVVNRGNASLLWPLGIYFEEQDDNPQAALVYNVIMQRAEVENNPYTKEQAAERINLIGMNRNVPTPVSVPVVLRVPEKRVVLNPPPPQPKKFSTSTPPPIVVQNDKHNVHDSSINASLKQSYQALKTSVYPIAETKSLSEVMKEIRDLCESNSKPETSENALKALDTIEKSVTPVSSLNDEKEANVLCTVYHRFKQQNHDTTLLVEKLAECIEKGTTVCTTGRVARVIDSLNVIDPLVSLKPRWAVRQEINQIASKLREEIADDDAFKQRLREKCDTDYVRSGLISKSLLDLELSWLNDL
jgi:hypothetical protein